MTKCIIIFLSIILIYNSQAQKLTSKNDKDINTILMKNTFRIAGQNSCGTGFVIGKKKTKTGQKFVDKSLQYESVFITAAHVLDSIKGENAIIYYRIQEKGGFKTINYPIKIRIKNKNLYIKHPTLDIAVLYITVPRMYFDLNYILTEDYLATDSTLQYWQIHPGDKIHCLGYPKCLNDSLGNFPILRTGEIASYPIIPTSIYKTFLFDFEVFPGNSGGPVYFYDNEFSRFSSEGTYSIGENPIQFILGIVTDQIFTKKTNTDLKIGVVLQAKYLLETINLLQ